MGLRTYIRARACVRVQSIYLVGGGLTIEVNIPLQELEGQRGEGAYIFGRIRYYDSVPKCHALAAVIAGDIFIHKAVTMMKLKLRNTIQIQLMYSHHLPHMKS